MAEIKPNTTFLSFCLLIMVQFIGINTTNAQSNTGKKSKIKFSSDAIIYDETLGNKAKRLIGNVVFEQDGVFMYCDSAYQYPENNSFDAFGNVHIEQGDSLDLYGDFLHYDGNTKVAKLNDNVKLTNKGLTLTTDKLIHYRLENYSHYFDGGTIVNKKDKNRLYSNIGYYYSTISTFHFKDSVRLYNENYTIETDTLDYNSESEITYFVGPTTIKSKENLIYCENGWYNTITDISTYYNNSYLINEKQKMEGDSLYYDRKLGYGEAFGHVQITDTVERILINGDFSSFLEAKDSAIVIGDSAYLTQFFDEDTLFLHADTFQIISDTNTTSREIFAYYQVKFFKHDLQGKCDSMVYSFSDSTIRMFTDPIIWNGENQLTSDFIELRMSNNEIESIFMDKKAFIASEIDPIRYNQIRGKVITGYFLNNELRKINVNGNGQTVYYSIDEEDKFIGVNRGESSDLVIMLLDNAIETISFINDPDATFYPVMELSPEELKLKGFNWRKHIRPRSKEDIFIWAEPSN